MMLQEKCRFRLQVINQGTLFDRLTLSGSVIFFRLTEVEAHIDSQTEHYLFESMGLQLSWDNIPKYVLQFASTSI